jgi:anti-anti-sigma regulatory factor
MDSNQATSNNIDVKTNSLEAEIQEIKNRIKTKYIIIDLSCVNIIDNQSVNAIKKLNEAYKEIGVNVCFSYVKRSIIRAFNKADLKSSCSYCDIYPTTHDAVVSILIENQEAVTSSSGGISLSLINDRKNKLTRINEKKNLENISIEEMSDAEDAIIEPKYTETDDINDLDEQTFDHLIENINK